MAIHLIEEDRKLTGVKKSPLREWLKFVIRESGKGEGIVNVIFCSDGYLVKINEQFLKKDYFTDVISFDYTKGNIIGGDIFMSLDRIKENSEERGISFPDELKRVMVHGVLHLIGYEDGKRKTKAEMTRLEDLYLARYREDGKY